MLTDPIREATMNAVNVRVFPGVMGLMGDFDISAKSIPNERISEIRPWKKDCAEKVHWGSGRSIRAESP
jgi:hypothetical protein